MRTFSWLSAKIEIRDTNKYGWGLFSNDLIEKDELILVMGGYIFSIEDENKLNSYNSDKPIEVSEDFSFSPITIEDSEKMPQHYINHSCDPNCGWKGQLFLVAMRDIQRDEEINYDYAMVMHKNDESDSFFEMSCLCGSSNCRKIISEQDWEKKELQEKYNGYFQYFIQEKINSLKNGETIKPLYKLPSNWKSFKKQ